ncbi:MAG: aspartate/glutamate racemase family protein [Selenomonadaceae bacterium]|nr:aspartate/glutamate racemase family protein [Selenomonadaceae bacterium]
MKTEKPFIVGALGVGTCATINFFEQWAKVFPAEKEWDRPRIIIDNNCTMPSRVRALLYNENVELLVEQMTDSIRLLINAGCSKILIACNTAHVFLEAIYKKFPEARNYIVDLIENCAAHLQSRGVKKVFLMASEGTILSGVYQEKLQAKGIECTAPPPEDFPIVRSFIEAVKQDKYTAEVKNSFVDFVNRNRLTGGGDYILGCTELPVMYEKCSGRLGGMNFYDPMIIVLEKLRAEFEDERHGKSLAETLEQPQGKF